MFYNNCLLYQGNHCHPVQSSFSSRKKQEKRLPLSNFYDQNLNVALTLYVLGALNDEKYLS
jgi:hypothetical protein